MKPFVIFIALKELVLELTHLNGILQNPGGEAVEQMSLEALYSYFLLSTMKKTCLVTRFILRKKLIQKGLG